jgi:hypothetical protein
MEASEVETISNVYLEAANGDLAEALKVAVADLLEIQAEAAFRAAALDQWVSQGYIQGRATAVLSGDRRSLWLHRLCGQE